MPYCGIECQSADWSKHKNICAQVSIMPKELPVEDDGFEVSLGEDIYEYLPKEDREAVKQVCGKKLTSYIQRTDEGYRNMISKVSPTHSSPKPEKISPTTHSPSQSNRKSNLTPNKNKPSPNKSPGKSRTKEEISIPNFKDLPHKVITMNTDILTIVTYIESPDSFWVSETKDMEHAFVYSQELEKDPVATIKKAPISGQLFACRYEGMWCRSQVLSLSSDSQMAKISYIDFGNVENVPLKRLHYLPPNMATIYPLAIECKINGIYPTDMKGWPKNCLLNYIQPNSLCTINVKQKYNTQYLVTLKGSEGADVIQSMIKANIAQRERSKVYSKHIKTLVQELKPGQEIKLLIVIAKSPRDFKAQIDEPTYRNILDAFTTELDRVCEQNSINQYRPEVDEIVSCKYVDSHWYRAVVLKVTNAAAIVYFLDYGDEQEIIQSNIQPLSGEQVDYPAQAIKCSLKDVKTFDPSYIDVVDQKFSDLSLRLECKYKAKVVDVQGDVAIVDLLDNKGRCVSDILRDCIDQASYQQQQSSGQAEVTTKQSENQHRKSPSPLFVAQSPKKLEKCETESLPLNQTVSCVFASFLPNSHFCVSLFTNFPFLAEIMTKINEECLRTSESYLPKIGEYICALFQGGWYRARTLIKDGDKITVYFLDYGNTSEVSVKEIRKLNPDHLQLPAQAIHCCFVGINVPLSSEQITQLETVLQHDKFNVKALTVVDKVYKVVVNLADSTNVNEIILQALSESQVEVSDTQSTSSLKLETPEDSPSTTSSSPTTSEVLTVQLPLNKPIECIFTSFLPEAKFCVGLFENLRNLAEIITEINTQCAASEESYLPKIGEYVAALFEGSWYRAEVLNILDDKITVLFIDYGNNSDVSVKEIRKLNPRHLKLPAQAITCSFDGIDAPLSKDQQTQLEGILHEDKLSVQASSVTDGVYRVTVIMSDSMNINEVLQQALSITETQPADAEKIHVSDTIENKPSAPPNVSESKIEAVSVPEVPTEKIPLNKSTTCIFTSFLPKSQFCVGLFENLRNLAEIITEINTQCSASEESYLPKIGEYVAALFEGSWYRAEVLNILDDKITVLFIDYGNNSDVSVKEIRKLNPRHLKLPAQAITCSFDGIDAPLSKDQQTQLEGILHEDKLSVQASSVTDGVYRVTVIMSDSMNINEVLQQALSITETQQAETEKAPKTDVKETEEKQVPRKLDTNSPKTPKGPSPIVSQAIAPSEVATEKLPLNKPIACVFTSFLPESQFCVSLHEKFTDLAEVMMKINKECKATPESYLPKIGEFVCALYQQMWYRANVLSHTDDKFIVIFIDYGNTSEVTVAEIRKLNPEHLEFPAQAIPCSFDGVKTPLTIEQQTELESILQSGIFTVHASSLVDEIHKVVVVLQNGSNINEVLKVAQEETMHEADIGKPPIDTPDPASPTNEITKTSLGQKERKLAPSEPESKSLLKMAACDFPLDGSEVLTMFATFLSSSEFCVLKADSYPTFCELSVEVNNYSTSNSDSYKPVIDESVCALYQDAWYRAQVKNISDDKYTVFFADFGNTHDVSSSEIRKILPCHLEFPSQAVKCCFAGLKSKIDKTKKAEVESYLSQAAFNVRIVGIQDGVHLAIVTLSDGTNLNEALIALLDKSDGNSSSKSDVEETQSKSFELKSTESIVTLDKPTSVGFEIQHINGICDFYVLVSDSSVKDALEAIDLELARVKPVDYKPMKGEYVCCKFEGVWYRAVVIDITSDANYEVLFIDYGNTSLVTPSSVRQFTSSLASIPPLALHCSLYNAIDNGQESLVKFAEFLNSNHDLKMILMEKKDDTHFVNVILSNGQCLNNEFRPKSPVIPTLAHSEIREEKLPQDKQVPCVFSCFLQDSVFCVSLYERHSKLASVMETLNGECTTTPESYLPKIGEHVSALYENMWYRAKVLNQKDDKFTVLFIDYGNTSDIFVKDIRKLNPSLLDLPAQAIKCSFYGIHIPLNSDQQAKIETMLNKDIINVQASSTVDEIYKVIVTLTDGININDVIIQAFSGSPTSETKPLKKTDSQKEEAVPEITLAPKREVEHYKMSDIKFVVPSDDELTVIFTHVVDPDNIYCHSASEGSTEAMMALSTLCQSMADYCEKSVMDVEPLVDHLYCGLMAGEDWYRCVVKELRNDKVLIQFIDIGEEKELLKYNLRPFLPEFMTLPVYIFKCAVNGIKPIGEKWGTGAGHLINSFTGDKNRIKVVRREEKLLYCDIVTGSGQTDLKTELLRQCLGVEKSTDHQPTPEEDEEEAIRRQIAELQAKLARKVKI
ncbi:hypothetical protein LOTGIDRAFT_159624 [Lottia gigantea]|uniref:Tudor domain-containing protein n=1 Tax=Lottia gigantea TaxID=225164 RepID=V4C5K3_LOTGI|nr:hypothetical protein LOTGIDRAFT_159624 [Lottia gigantea]ESO96874.1 hypothetical protein LOTGIDRAFT_159624 [Lottia gigantea]